MMEMFNAATLSRLLGTWFALSLLGTTGAIVAAVGICRVLGWL